MTELRNLTEAEKHLVKALKNTSLVIPINVDKTQCIVVGNYQFKYNVVDKLLKREVFIFDKEDSGNLYYKPTDRIIICWERMTKIWSDTIKYKVENFIESPYFRLDPLVIVHGLENLRFTTREVLYRDAVNWLEGYHTIRQSKTKEWLDTVLNLNTSVTVCEKFIQDCEALIE